MPVLCSGGFGQTKGGGTQGKEEPEDERHLDERKGIVEQHRRSEGED